MAIALVFQDLAELVCEALDADTLLDDLSQVSPGVVLDLVTVEADADAEHEGTETLHQTLLLVTLRRWHLRNQLM